MRQDRLAPAFRSPCAFTLVEVVVAMGIGLVVLGLLVRLYIVATQGVDAQHKVLEQTAQIRELLWDVKCDVRGAVKVAAAFQTHQSGERTMVLEVPALDSRGRAFPDRRDWIVYQSSDEGVRRLVVPGAGSSRQPSDAKLAEGATALRFEYGDADVERSPLVTVHVRDERSIDRRESTFPATIAVRLRNHP